MLILLAHTDKPLQRAIRTERGKESFGPMDLLLVLHLEVLDGPLVVFRTISMLCSVAPNTTPHTHTTPQALTAG